MTLRGILARGPSFNEGSLLRRTLVHVGTMVLGSVAFLAITSLVLVSITKGILPDHGSREDTAPAGAAAASGAATTRTLSPKALGKRPRPGAPAEPPPANDEEE